MYNCFGGYLYPYIGRCNLLYKENTKENHLKIAKNISDLGIIPIKLAQWCAYFCEIHYENNIFVNSLKYLQCECPSYTNETIEKDLEPFQDILFSWEKNPISSASIAQVYRGKLKTGENVIIKIKHKNITIYSISLVLLVASIIGIYQIKTSGSLLEDMPKNAEFFKDIEFYEKEFPEPETLFDDYSGRGTAAKTAERSHDHVCRSAGHAENPRSAENDRNPELAAQAAKARQRSAA